MWWLQAGRAGQPAVAMSSNHTAAHWHPLIGPVHSSPPTADELPPSHAGGAQALRAGEIGADLLYRGARFVQNHDSVAGARRAVNVLLDHPGERAPFRLGFFLGHGATQPPVTET